MSNKYLSTYVQMIPKSGIRRFFDIAAEMEDVVTLGVGEPDFVTPWHIREEAIYSLEKGFTMYTSNQGLIELRELISCQLHEEQSVKYSKDDIIVTVGVSEALDLAMRSLLSADDEILIIEPCYVSYQACAILVGAKPIMVPTYPENDFSVCAADIEKKITEKTKVLLLCYPNNPTGATISSDELEKIAELAVKYDLIVLSDEIYSKLNYCFDHVSIASFSGMKERTVVLNGFSKAYAMTGWRVGYAVGPSEIIQAMTKIHQYTMLCAPISAQKAAIEAMLKGKEQMEMMVRKYDQRRKLIVHGLNQIGLKCIMPQGAFYAFPSIAGMGMEDDEFAEKLLFEGKVAVVPGSVFGPSGKGFIRCSYATSVDDINMALDRMEAFIKKL